MFYRRSIGSLNHAALPFYASLKERVPCRKLSGATAIEYGLIAAGISVVIIATVNAIGSTLNAKFDYISQQLK